MAVSIQNTAKRGYDNYAWLMYVFITGSIAIPIAGLKGGLAPLVTFSAFWLLGHFHKSVSTEKGEPMDPH